MPVYSDNAVCVFIYNSTLGVHAEGTHLIPVFLGAVYDFTFVKLIGKMRKNLRRQFHAHTKINAVGFCGAFQFITNAFHPLTAAASNGNDTFFAGKAFLCTIYRIAIFQNGNGIDGCIEEEIYLILQMCIKIFQNNIIYIRTQMTHRCVQKVQVILDTKLFELCAGGGIQLCACTAITHIDGVNILH